MQGWAARSEPGGHANAEKARTATLAPIGVIITRLDMGTAA